MNRRLRQNIPLIVMALALASNCLAQDPLGTLASGTTNSVLRAINIAAPLVAVGMGGSILVHREGGVLKRVIGMAIALTIMLTANIWAGFLGTL